MLELAVKRRRLAHGRREQRRHEPVEQAGGVGAEQLRNVRKELVARVAGVDGG